MRRVLLGVGRAHAFERRQWEASIVVVERGTLALDWPDGSTLTFETGDVLCLAPLGLESLRAMGRKPVLLLVIRR